MLNKLTMLAALCTLGLVACGPGTSSDPQVDTITLKLSQMEDGDLQYCDEATGECQDLPYDGECVIVEVDIDPNTGGTCERCITADGEVIDMGCSNTSVGCVLVTLPDPDCVVCAYVNGAIIFSSCVADDVPECNTDEDCFDSAGQRGFCLDGQCIYDEGCIDDNQCPPGFQCVFPDFVDPAAGSNDPTTNLVGGTCVPRDIPCLSDAECPADMMCEVWCWSDGFDPANCADPDGTNCMPPEQCEGICVDRPFDPCANVLCPDGQHCELACWADGTTTSPDDANADQAPCFEGDPNCGGFGGCEPICVPDPTHCQSDADCGANEVCEMWCYEPGDPTVPACDPAAGEECAPPPPCEGICVPHYQDPCEIIDLDCGEGRHCEVMCYDLPCDTSIDPWCGCEAVCVDDWDHCTSNADCAEGEMCEIWCDMPPDCVDPNSADCVPPPCVGACVPVVNYCFSNDDCPAGQVCELYDGTMPPNCDPPSGNCDCIGSDCGLWAPGICVDDRPVDDCFRTGCSGEICADEHIDSTCEWLPEYACFDRAVCERQADGACGWTFTPEFEVCLQQP